MSGRPATTGIIPGRYAICVGKADMPSPPGWTWTLLSDIARLETGHTPSRRHPEYWDNGDIPWVGIKDARLHHGRPIHETIQTVTQLGIDNSAARLLPAGTVCLSRTASVGYVLVMGRDMATSQDFVNWICTDALLPEFLMYALMAEGEDIRKFGKGTTHTTIYFPEVKAFHICVPPINVQCRIVNKLQELFSDLDAAVAALKRAKANLKNYRAAVLTAAVEGKLTAEWRATHPTESASKLLERILAERRKMWEADQLAKFAAAGKEPPGNWKAKYVEPKAPDTSGLPELPATWTIANLEQLTSAVRPICYGILMPKENVADGVLYVKVKDMKGDRIDLAGLHRTRRKIADEYARASLKQGDLLLAIRGTYGRVAEVPQELDGGNITQDTARLSTASEIDTRYAATALRASVCQTYFKRVARGVAVKGVNIADVRLCPIFLPPLTEQRQIVAEVAEKLSQIEASESAIDHGLIRAGRLRQAILKQAFEGKLVSQDPNDELASLLLERQQFSRSDRQSNGKTKPLARPRGRKVNSK